MQFCSQELINLPEILDSLLKLIKQKSKRYIPPNVREVILGLVYSGVKLNNNHLILTLQVQIS